MSRVSKGRKTYEPQRQKKVEVSGRLIGVRIVVVILLVLIAVGAFTYGISSLFTAEKGWQEISADSTADTNASSEFTFLYNIGQDGESATASRKALIKLYTDEMVQAFKAYNVDESETEQDGTANLYDLNHNPNEILTVSPELYAALRKMEESGLRNLYLGPVYEAYDDIFYVTDESQTVDFNPYQNGEIRDYYQEIADYAGDPASISLDFPGENQVRLNISVDYLAFAEENGTRNFLDFFWMKNAFILDNAAAAVISAGYTDGVISSSDGFVRILGDVDQQEFKLYGRDGNEISYAESLYFTQTASLVSLRNFPLPNDNAGWYQETSDGDICTPYLDTADGKYKSSLGSMVSYSYDEDISCADVLTEMIPVFITDTFGEQQESEISGMLKQGIYTVYVKDGIIVSNEQ